MKKKLFIMAILCASLLAACGRSTSQTVIHDLTSAVEAMESDDDMELEDFNAVINAYRMTCEKAEYAYERGEIRYNDYVEIGHLQQRFEKALNKRIGNTVDNLYNELIEKERK